MTEAELLDKIMQARKRLLLDYPWWGTLALLLKPELSDKPKHAAHTDGTFVRFRPDYVEQVSMEELMVLWAHEAGGHCALQHPYRRGSRDLGEYNIAADYAVNALLKAGGMKIPKGWLYDEQYEGMSAEQIYAKRQRGKDQQQQQQPQQQPQGQQGKPQGGGAGQQPQPQPGQQPCQPDESNQPGEFGDAEQAVEDGQGQQQQGQQPSAGGGQPAPNSPQPQANTPQPGGGQPAPKMTAEDWKVAGEQATRVYAKAGNDPGAIGRAAKATHEPDTDWRGELQEFIEHQQPSDYGWSSPNRRHIASGLYLPGIHKENLGTGVIGIDVSMSISPRLFDLFTSHLQAIMKEARPEKVLVVYWDTKVQATEEFTPDDFEATLHTTGGGGTTPQCMFDHLATLDEPPTFVINFTDLEFYGQPKEPEDYPVLWVTGVDVRRQAPWGRVVRIDAWGN